MNQTDLKKENAKALKILLLICVLSGLVGGILGVASAFVEGTDMVKNIRIITKNVLQAMIPWGIPMAILGLQFPAFVFLKKAGNKFKMWDGEDEDTAERIDKDIHKVLLFVDLSLPLCIFFMSCASEKMTGVIIAEFIISMIIAMIIQQKSVDLLRMMNPEKKGSVYDFKFQKKWLDSCDEAEHKKIGEASYKSYKVTQMSCIILWLLLLFMDKIFHTGILPIFIVLLIFSISTVSYMIEAMK